MVKSHSSRARVPGSGERLPVLHVTWGELSGALGLAKRGVHGTSSKRLKHRVFDLYRPGILNNARNELKIGVLRVLLVFSKSTMMQIDISIISV